MNKPLLTAASAAARYGLVALLGAGAALAATAPAPAAAASTTTEKKDEPQKLEKFEVTGSRVKRLDVETPAPVQSFSIADIEAKGYVNIGDFIQSLPFNSGAGNAIFQTASFTRGAAVTNIRGLGAERFLVLVDGRRAVQYGLSNSGNRAVFDFNSLPPSAIESVEFLKDGASAIYGADAITGVLNVKLKKNFVGLSTTGTYGNTFGDGHGGDTGLKRISMVAGAQSAKTHVMFAFDVSTQNSNFIRDYGVTTTDYTLSLGTNKGANQNSTLNWPANISLSAAQVASIATATGRTLTAGNYGITGGQPTASPTLNSFSAIGSITNENRYNFAQTYQLFPAYTYMSGYVNFEHEFNESLKAFGSVAFSDNNTYYAFTPGVINYSTEGLTLPANNPYNPFGIALTTLLGRTNFGPVRKFDTESVTSNSVFGFRGSILNRWDWESAVSYGVNNITSINRNAIRATTFQSALNGTLSGFTGKFLNPFGPSDAGLTAALFTNSQGSNRSETLGWDGNVSGRLMDLPAGELGMALGLEWRDTRFQTNPDTQAYLGSGGGQPLKGARKVLSEYAELTAPVYRGPAGSVELQVAARHEDYSDFGNVTKPKYGFKYRLPENRVANIVLRGSYSESFQAPALPLMYASQTVAFSSALLQDPLRPQDAPQQQRIVTGGNPNLLPELGKTWYGGVVVEIPRVKDLSFNIDYFQYRINQVIVTPSSTFLLSANGMAQFPNAIVRDNTVGNPGPILRIESVPSNNPRAWQVYRGVDIGFKYRLRNTEIGEFNFSADGTRILEKSSDSGLGGGSFENLGLLFDPKWRATAGIGWRYKDWGASVNADYIGKFFNDGYTTAGWGENPFTTIHTNVSYRGLWGTTITVGVNNVFDNRSPANGRDTSGISPYHPIGALGRFGFVRVRKDF
jgi:outer membrane receptor protein involved in Fe transport